MSYFTICVNTALMVILELSVPRKNCREDFIGLAYRNMFKSVVDVASHVQKGSRVTVVIKQL